MTTAKDLDKIIFVYNGKEEIEASRSAVADSCTYFNRLLTGGFKEASQTRISIQLEGFSFPVFESIINYANTKDFDNKQTFAHYVDLIQLADLWMFDELTGLLELHLIEYVSLENIANLHTLANMLNLSKLLEKCLDFEKILDAGGTMVRGWGRCPLPGHENHHYSNCVAETRNNQDEDWDREPDQPTASLTDAERDRLADHRFEVNSYEYANTKRYMYRRRFL